MPCRVALVPGNHDGETGVGVLSELIAARPDSNVQLATDAGTPVLDGVTLAGRGIQPRDGRSLAAPNAVDSWGDDLVVWVSHFPVASLLTTCRRAGLLFAGDADDVDAASAQLSQRDGLTVALTGHLHIRHSEAHGAILHLGAGALVEPPGDVAILEVSRYPTPSVRRRVWETHAPPGQRLPVLAPLDEAFVMQRHGEWARVSEDFTLTIDVSHSGLGIIAFDWNGTLVDDCHEAWMATTDVLESRGLQPLSRRAFSAAFCLPLPHFFARLGIEDPKRAADEWNERMANSQAVLMPGARAILDRLRAEGVATGVVSAAARAVVESQVRQHDLADHFDFVEAGAANKSRFLAHLGQLAPGRVAFLGDTEYDIAEARFAGIRAWGFARGYRPAEALRSAGAERVIESLESVRELAGSFSEGSAYRNGVDS